MNTEKLIERAKMEAGRRNYDGAIVYFHQALAIDPAHRDARRGVREAELKKYEHIYPSGLTRFLVGFGPRLGLLFASLTKNRTKRMEAIEKVLATDPKNAALGMRLGAEANAAGLHGATAAAYEGVLLGNPGNVEAMKALGRALQALGEIPEALRILEEAVKADPRDQEAQRLRKDLSAEGYALDAGFATARTTHDLLRDKDQARRLEKAQKIVRAEEDLEEVARTAREAAAAAPQDAAAQAALGAAEAALRRYAEAEAAYGKACALAPDEATHRTRLGDVRIARVDRAIAEVRPKAEAGDGAAQGRLAALERERREILVEEYRERVRTHPTDLALRFAFAGHLEAVGDVEAALAEYQHSVKDPRRRLESLGGLGRCFMAKGMLDLAAKQLERALAEAGGTGDKQKQILYDLATVEEKQGDVAKARDHLARIYEVDIGYMDVAQRLERLQGAAGR